jgi:hypothetical protein
MMSWALANMWKSGQEGGYCIRHGHQPVGDFGRPGDSEIVRGPNRPNFFEKAFPCLFPYGRGGIEADQEVDISFQDHVKWALQYFDRQFCKHETFPFVAFGISQHHQALYSACIQMHRRNFEHDARILSMITAEKLEQAREEEAKSQPISDPAVRLLRQHVHATVGHVTGSDQKRCQLRSQIWSTSISKGPPALWITINPCDLHDPIAQIFAGEHIDLDNFFATAGPDKDKRTQNIAADPFAAAKFFHFMIHTILETLLGIEVSSFQVKSFMGILGRVAAYFGTVESQGRGTLHLHLLIWLMNAPSADELVALLKTEAFQLHVIAYICANLQAYLPGLDSAEHVKHIPREPEIAYSRPPNPDSAEYDSQL